MRKLLRKSLFKTNKINKIIPMIRIFLFLIIVTTVFSQKCEYTDENGNNYDLSSIAKPLHWKVKDSNGDSGLFAMDYMFSFCKNVDLKCKGKNVGAYEVLEVLGQQTETCEVLGLEDKKVVKPLDVNAPHKGIKITYTGGDTCTGSEVPNENGQPRKINFLIKCSKTEESNFLQYKINPPAITKCNLEFKIRSPAGCPLNYSSTGDSFRWLIIVLLIFGGSVLGIYFYNVKFNGKSGMEAFPEFLKEIPQLAIDGANYSVEIANDLMGKITKKGGSGSSKGGWSAV